MRWNSRRRLEVWEGQPPPPSPLACKIAKTLGLAVELPLNYCEQRSSPQNLHSSAVIRTGERTLFQAGTEGNFFAKCGKDWLSVLSVAGGEEHAVGLEAAHLAGGEVGDDYDAATD